ncbi:unnamed protein product [Boreogadus saida]
MPGLIKDMHVLGAFSTSRRIEGQSNFNNAHANFLCAIAKRGMATSQWCYKRTRGFVAASGDDSIRLEKGIISEMWSVFSTMGVQDWGAFIKFLTNAMVKMGLKECSQMMHQAANSGHTSCVLIHRAVMGRPDFNWVQILTGTYFRCMRPTDKEFVDNTGEWYTAQMNAKGGGLTPEEYEELERSTRAEALRLNAEQLKTGIQASSRLLAALMGELTVWRAAMQSLKDDPYQVFSHDHTGVSPQMRNLAYLCWKIGTDVMGDHSLTSYAGFKSGGVLYMKEIDRLVSEYKSRITDDLDMDAQCSCGGFHSVKKLHNPTPKLQSARSPSNGPHIPSPTSVTARQVQRHHALC